MIIKGAICRNPGYSDADQSIEYLLNEQLATQVSDYLYSNLNNEVDFKVYFIIEEENSYKLLYSEIFSGSVEEKYGCIGLFIENPSFDIRNIGHMSVRPMRHPDTLVVLDCFSRESCEQYGSEYIEFEAEDE